VYVGIILLLAVAFCMPSKYNRTLRRDYCGSSIMKSSTDA
jgi:hypothetical protein